VTTLISPPGWTVDDSAEISFPASAPGVIGGAVVSAARRSASLSRSDLASAMAVSPTIVSGWEDGTRPLFCVRYDRLHQLADALHHAGACVGQHVNELVLASQCDLLFTGILRGFEDYADVPPIDEDAAGEDARSLLRWALTGTVPDRYRAHAPAGRLLAWPEVILLATVARDLQTGSHGGDLARFGRALAALTRGARMAAAAAWDVRRADESRD
jgi:hypothetical protein